MSYRRAQCRTLQGLLRLAAQLQVPSRAGTRQRRFGNHRRRTEIAPGWIDAGNVRRNKTIFLRLRIIFPADDHHLQWWINFTWFYNFAPFSSLDSTIGFILWSRTTDTAATNIINAIRWTILNTVNLRAGSISLMISYLHQRQRPITISAFTSKMTYFSSYSYYCISLKNTQDIVWR